MSPSSKPRLGSHWQSGILAVPRGLRFCDQIKPEWDCQSFYIIIRLSSRSVPPIGTQHETRHLCQALARARSRSPTHHPPRRTSRSVPSRLRLASDCAIASVIAAMRGYYIIAPGTDRCIRKSKPKSGRCMQYVSVSTCTQADHCPLTLGDPFSLSMRMRFSVHTGDFFKWQWTCGP